MSRLTRLRRYLAGDAPGMSVDEQSATETALAERAGGDDRLSGPVAVVIALATLIAAVAGFQQADTSELADDQRLNATRLGLEAAASAQREQQRTQVEYQIYVRSVEQQTAAGNAMLRGLYAEPDTAEERRFELERERWQALANATAASTEIKPDAEYGPERDDLFPSRYFASAAYDSHRRNALQDAYNAQANLLDERSAAYTAILAVLAVAVYLLGLTLAVREYLLRRLFLALGVVLMLVAGAWTALTAGLPVPPVNVEAAAAYAEARVESDTAHDSAGHARAKVLYDRAIELRPSYARAYLERASAIIFAATPQQTGLVSLVPADALREAQADLERALELGSATASTYGRLGFYEFLEGVQLGDRGSLADSVAASRRAIELDPAEPVYRLNLAVALVALEQHAEAGAAYDAGVRHVLFIEGDVDRRRGEVWQEQQWLAGALTDLEVVARHRPELAPQVEAYKGSIVGRIGAATLEAPVDSAVMASDVQLDVYPGNVQWQARLDGYDPAADVVSVQWYRAAPGTDELAVIPEISNSSAPHLGEDGRYGIQMAYLGAFSPPACLPTGTYRAEIYVNGALVATEDVTPEFGELEATADRDVTLAFCRPAGWQPIAEPLPGLMRGYTSADADRGVYVMRMALPRSFTALDEITTLIVDTALSSFGDVFPGQPTYLESEGTTDHYFLGLDKTAWRWYDYETGYVRVAAGVTSDGAVMMAMVFGPYDWFQEDEPYTVLNSMQLFE